MRKNTRNSPVRKFAEAEADDDFEGLDVDNIDDFDAAAQDDAELDELGFKDMDDFDTQAHEDYEGDEEDNLGDPDDDFDIDAINESTWIEVVSETQLDDGDYNLGLMFLNAISETSSGSEALKKIRDTLQLDIQDMVDDDDTLTVGTPVSNKELIGMIKMYFTKMAEVIANQLGE